MARQYIDQLADGGFPLRHRHHVYHGSGKCSMVILHGCLQLVNLKYFQHGYQDRGTQGALGKAFLQQGRIASSHQLPVCLIFCRLAHICLDGIPKPPLVYDVFEVHSSRSL